MTHQYLNKHIKIDRVMSPYLDAQYDMQFMQFHTKSELRVHIFKFFIHLMHLIAKLIHSVHIDNTILMFTSKDSLHHSGTKATKLHKSKHL